MNSFFSEKNCFEAKLKKLKASEGHSSTLSCCYLYRQNSGFFSFKETVPMVGTHRVVNILINNTCLAIGGHIF